MSLQVENLEHNMARLTIEASAEDFEKACQSAYQKQKGRISIPGFRKGKAPRKLIEKMYGAGVFYEDAANELIPEVYRRETEEHEELDIVSRPSIDVVQIEAGKPFIFTAEVALKPPVELGKYKGVKCTKVDTTVTDEEVDAKVEEELNRDARIVAVTDRAVKDKDIVNINFEGFVDGEAFDGGKGEDHDLTIGSHSFIDTFEDQLIGKKIDEDTDVNVTFPEDYHEKSLAGKEALFKVHINSIKERQKPELDDEYVSDKDFDTVADYKEDIRKKLTEKKENEAKAKNEDEIIEAIIEDSKMDIPEAMEDTEAENLVNGFARNITSQGMSLEMYMQYTGMTMDRLKDQMKEQAGKNIRSRLVLEAIADAEKIEATDEEFDEEVKKMAEQYRMEPDKLKDLMGDEEKKNLRHDVVMQKVCDFILKEAKPAAEKSSKKKKKDGE
ncbi:MAG: trigger factor [Lachnospiraceae bacterium]|nr:trigger factor [Lachnospiraceae bacterium]